MVTIPEKNTIAWKDLFVRLARQKDARHWDGYQYLQQTRFLDLIQDRTGIRYVASLHAGLDALANGTTTKDLSIHGMEQLRTLLAETGLDPAQLAKALDMFVTPTRSFMTIKEVNQNITKRKAYLAEPLPTPVTDQESALTFLAKTQFLQQLPPSFMTKPQTLVDALASLYYEEGLGYYEGKAYEKLPNFDIDEEAIPVYLGAIQLITTSDDQRLTDLIQMVEAHLVATPSPNKVADEAETSFKLTSDEQQDADLTPDSRVEVLDPQLVTDANGRHHLRFAMYSPFSDIFNGKGTEVTTLITHQGQEHVLDTRVINKQTAEEHALDKELIATEQDRYTFRNSPVRFELELPEGVTSRFSVTIRAAKHTRVIEAKLPFYQLEKVTEVATAQQ